MNTQHSWKKYHAFAGQRFAFGMMVASALTLVAFEWRTNEAPRIVDRPVLDSDWLEPEIMPPAPIKEKLEPEVKKKAKTTSHLVIAVVEPVPDPSPEPDPGKTDPDPGPALTMAALDGLLGIDSASLTPPVEWIFRAEVMPYFMDCLKRDKAHLSECTETRMKNWFERNFHMPHTQRKSVRTTITFQVDKQGRIGDIVCAPRVSNEVTAEVERVLRSMPQMMPATQGGIPVGVYYQIPLNMRVY